MPWKQIAASAYRARVSLDSSRPSMSIDRGGAAETPPTTLSRMTSYLKDIRTSFTLPRKSKSAYDQSDWRSSFALTAESRVSRPGEKGAFATNVRAKRTFGGTWFFPDPPFSALYEGRLPDGDSFLRWWDLLLVIALCYLAFITPLQIAFAPVGCYAQDNLFVTDLVVDIVFFLDIIFNFKTANYTINSQGKVVLVQDMKGIAMKYLRTTFLLDFVAQLSMIGNYSECIWNDTDKTLRFFLQIMALLRLGRLHRVLRLKRTLQFRFRLSSIFFTSIQLIFFILGLCHYQACIWFLIGILSDEATAGWAVTESRQDVTFHSDDFGQTYVLSLYWSVVTVTGTGYGDYTGNTLYERIYCIIVMISGGFMLSIIIGNMGHMIRYCRLLSNP